jgi:hypothetical protein
MKKKKGYTKFTWKGEWEIVEILSHKTFDTSGGDEYISYLVKRDNGEITEKSNVYLI